MATTRNGKQRTVNELHLFAGAGGGILGGMLLGHTCVCAVEIKPYRRKVLLQRQRDGILPKFPIWDDVRTFDGKPWKGLVDVVCAGIPCQKVSVAGDGDESGFLETDYWYHFKRIGREIRPKGFLLENSAALLVRGFGSVLGYFSEIGYDVRWDVISAGQLGAWHNRPRIWILATDPMQIGNSGLFKGVRSGQVGPWGSISKEDLLHVLEEPTGNNGQIKPLLSGDDYGMADWVDRVESIGDGQVPCVVKLAWETLSQ